MKEEILKNIKETMYFDSNLGPNACKNKEAIRLKEEKEYYRPPFFHDADRIIYSLAYTRYMNKTQVFTSSGNDNVATRAVHVQLTSKIGRTIGRALGLNEDLIEAASLGHDIGHTPFGHVGESILNDISLKVGEGYFNHNIQSVRKLEFIENHGVGLNLTMQVVDAIMCHNGELELECYRPKKKTYEEVLEEYKSTYQDKNANTSLIPCTLEGCVVRISDIISYLGRDIEDGLRLHILSKEELDIDVFRKVGKTNREIVNYFIYDIILNSYGKDYIKMSKEAFNNLSQIKKFNYEHIYAKASTKEERQTWKHMIETVFAKCLEDLKQNREESHVYIYFYKYMNEEYKKNTSKERVVIDYISGMTDNFLIKEYEFFNK